MSKNANAGELRTPVYFKKIERTTNNRGIIISNGETNVFGEGVPVMCKWVNAHGSEVFDAMQLGVKEPATVTMRYSPLINETLIVYRGDDTKPYEVISIDNVENRSVWLEIKVKRVVSAR